MREALLILNKHFYHKPAELRKILEGFKKIEDIMEAPKDAFFKLGIKGKALDEFVNSRNQESNRAIKREDAKIITILDKEYPEKLKNIYDAPPILFYRGDIGLLEAGGKMPELAVIGSRRISDYGRRATEFFVRGLSRDFIIVSGLAYGVDGLAHEITVKNGGKAIAVLGSGLNNVYPAANSRLAEKIVEAGGLLLSEIPPGGLPQKFHFPMRNRIIAGLSRGILIIEGGKKSGTLITAKFGLEFNADIFAVPGGIFSASAEGVNFLIKCGAHPVTSVSDIFEFYNLERKEGGGYKPKNKNEEKILSCLSGEAKGTQEMADLTGIKIMDLMETLTELEMSGAIKNLGGNKYIKL